MSAMDIIDDEQKNISTVRNVLMQLPPENLNLLYSLLSLLEQICVNSAKNMMDTDNVSRYYHNLLCDIYIYIYMYHQSL